MNKRFRLWNVYARIGYYITRFVIEAPDKDSAVLEVVKYHKEHSGSYNRQANFEYYVTEWRPFFSHDDSDCRIFGSYNESVVPDWAERWRPKVREMIEK